MKVLKPISVAILLAFLGCGRGGHRSIPDWYLSTEADPEYIVGRGAGTSRDLNLAISEATMEARKEVAQQVEIDVQNLFKKFSEETGSSDDAVLLKQITDVSKSITDVTLRGSTVVHREIREPSGDKHDYQAYVLVEVAADAVNSALAQGIRTEEEMYTRFRASEAFRELDAAVGN